MTSVHTIETVDSQPTPLSQLRTLFDAGEFHHATYRCQNTLWEGLWFYRKSATGFRGYEPAGCVPKASAELDDAYRFLMSRGIGSHLGSYGNG